jgi:hypothetical protein
MVVETRKAGGMVNDLLYFGLTLLFLLITRGLITLCERLMEVKP